LLPANPGGSVENLAGKKAEDNIVGVDNDTRLNARGSGPISGLTKPVGEMTRRYVPLRVCSCLRDFHPLPLSGQAMSRPVRFARGVTQDLCKS